MGLKVFGLCLLVLALVSGPVSTASFQTYTSAKKIELGTQATLSWETFMDAGLAKIRFLVQKNAAGYIAFGIGSSMASADIVVIERTASTVTLKDCKLTGQAKPTCGETVESWALTAPDNFELTASSMKVELVRTLATSGVDDDKTIADGTNDFVYAYTTSDTLTKHDATGGKGTVKFDLKTGALVKSNSSLVAVCKVALAILATAYIF